MQTDFLLTHLNSSINDLKSKINAIEQQPIPTIQASQELIHALNECLKFAATYLVISENEKVVADKNLHLKLMSVQPSVSVPIQTRTEPEKSAEVKPIEIIKEITATEKPVLENVKTVEEVVQEIGIAKFPAINISINDKFRFINELFSSNTTEYNIAIEQINAVNNVDEANAYFKGLQSVYDWDVENEMFKKLLQLTHKRFS